MHIKYGMTHGDPLAMLAYGIEVIPLIREIQYTHTRVTQPWYAYYAGLGVSFGNILAHLQDLQGRGQPQGYFPETIKSILVLSPQNIARTKALFRGM